MAYGAYCLRSFSCRLCNLHSAKMLDVYMYIKKKNYLTRMILNLVPSLHVPPGKKRERGVWGET